MANLRALILASAALVGLGRAALAADLLPPPPVIEPAPPAAEFGGWYLRGDVGLSTNSSSIDLENVPNPLATGFYSAAATQSFNNTSLSSSMLFDFGVGYQVNAWLRGDITLEYRDGGHFQSMYTLNDSTTNTQYADFYRGDTSSLIGLANVYADVGTWYGITPFVGGGIGFARNSLYGVTDQGLVTVNGGATGPSGGYFGNGVSSSFAWALMAGFDFDVTQNLKLEVGYRYLNYGKIGYGRLELPERHGRGQRLLGRQLRRFEQLRPLDQYARLQRLPSRSDLDAP